MCALSLTKTTPVGATSVARTFDRVTAQVGEVILGKERAIRMALACLVARGHLLIEDIPGVGKTTLAHALARVFGLSYNRIQFTSDLLPADILGISVFDRNTGAFEFHPGPIFSQVILADEVNRATPKAQSALLEAMEEQQVTQDGVTRALPEPFFVIATQNPSRQVGTFALPESQLDRFLMRIELGYPDAAAERALLKGRDRREVLDGIVPLMSIEDLRGLQAAVLDVHVSDALLDYVQGIISYTRNAPDYEAGLSPRAGLALVRSAQSWAMIHGRGHVLPEDVQAVLPGAVAHRLHPVVDQGDHSPLAMVEELIRQVPIP